MNGSEWDSRRLRRVAAAGLVSVLAMAAAQARAADECGAPGADGKVVCDAAGSPYGDIDYNGEDGLDLTVADGAVVNGTISALGDGAIKVTSVEGSQINGQITPALDIGSTSGTVDIDVHQVTGQLHGVAAVAGGDVTVTADHVTATIAIQADSVDGNVTVDARELHTVGEGGAGVVATTEGGTITVTAEQIHGTDSFYTQGVAAFSDSGDINIDVGTIDIEGHRSEGIRIESYSGDVDVKVDSIAIEGGEIVGVSVVNDTGHTKIDAGSIVLEGNVARGIFATSFSDIEVTADYVETNGFIADGLQLNTTEGDVTAAVAQIVTKGDWSAGIGVEAGGDVALDLGTVTTHGEYGDGVSAISGGDLLLEADRIETFGTGSSGIIAGTVDGNQTIKVGTVIAHGTRNGGGVAIGTSAFRGDIEIEVGEAAISRRDVAIVTQSDRGAVRVAVAEGAVVRGKTGGIFASSADGTLLDIDGTVVAADGPTLDLRGARADVRIGETGTVRGSMSLTGRNDLMTNAGQLVLSGRSDFGEGTDMLFNEGLVRLAPANGPALVRIANLERLENGGLISLANGRTGDRLAIAGELAGTNGGTVALDVSLANGGRADSLRVGSLAGTSVVDLNLAEEVGGLGLGVTLVKVADGGEAGQLVLAEEDRSLGFVDFGLRFNEAGKAWRLTGDLNAHGYRTVIAGVGARDLWREGVRAWSTQLAAARSGDAEGLFFWTQGLIGENEREGDAVAFSGTRRLRWETDHDGVQFGVEKAANGWRFGLVGGYGSAETDFGLGEETRFDGVNVGAYVGYSSRGWFANAMIRHDWLDVDTDWESVDLAGEGDANMIGAALEIGHRADFGGMSIEPFASVQWTDLDLPDLGGKYGSVRYSGGTSLTGEVGVRLEAMDGWAGLPFRPSLIAAYAVEGGEGDRADLTVAGKTVRIEEDGTRSYGRAGLGLARDIGPLQLFARGEGRFGEVDGYNAVIGAKFSF